jgi:hypothetical protein
MLLQMKLKVVNTLIRTRLFPKNTTFWNVIAHYVFKDGSEERTISVVKVRQGQVEEKRMDSS